MKPTPLGLLEGGNLNLWTSKIKMLKWIKATHLGPLEGANLNHWTSKKKG
jgi:hypothetical protein